MGQKSAEVVVGKDVTTHGGVVAGNKPGIFTDCREDLPAEGPNSKRGMSFLMSFPIHHQSPTG